MKNYKILLHPIALQTLQTYKQQLLSQEASAGPFLHKKLANKTVSDLSDEAFLEALINTKKPKFFAESGIKGKGSDWNKQELSILGDISIAVPVDIFDNGAHHRPLVYDEPIKGTLLFTPGALLESGGNVKPADWHDVVTDDEFDFKGYYELYERRLLPPFLYANAQSAEKKAVITIPGLGCGMFAGPFHGQLGEMLRRVLSQFLEKHSSKFPHIKAVYFDPYRECNNERFEINGISLLVRPLTQQNEGKSQLSKVAILEDVENEFENCALFSVVAWDHVSWPGNDFYIDSRGTDDGVKAAATSTMFAMTGIKGEYDKSTFKYLPPKTYHNWEEVVTRHDLTLMVLDNLEILPA